MKKSNKIKEIKDGVWYPWKKKGDIHMCCGCQLEHYVEFRVDSLGRIWMKWILLNKR